MSKYWSDYDVFNKQKMSTFKSSRPAVLELAARYREITERTGKDSSVGDSEDPEKAEKLLFTEMVEICLWGNATDLSLLTSLSYEDIQKLQGSTARKEQEKNILVNDLSAAFDVLNTLRRSGTETRRVDIVLDNAGFELYVDLILAGYLLSTGLATEVVLHPKSIPWFVSDVLPKDFADLLGVIANPQAFYSVSDDKHNGESPAPLSEGEAADLKFLFDQWSHFHTDGKLILRPNRFWTHAGSFWRMPHTAPGLLKDLKQSELVIFKGDLNYRKLTGDVCKFPDSLAHITTDTYARLLGIQPRHLRLQLDHLEDLIAEASNLASGLLLFGHARRMLWSVCRQARMRKSGRQRAVAGTRGQGNGLGVESGL